MQINLTKAIELIQSSKGKYMTIANTKKDGSDRTYKSSKYSGISYGNILVQEKGKGYRNIIPSTIYMLRTQGKTYEVKRAE